jgi:4-amino-4-deoxy-L-arabinose transferase-like glycosyltransferase
MNAIFDLWRRSPSICVAFAIAVFVALRVAVVVASPLEIGPDEAQYWRWAQTLDFGYYSKPPLVAWVIWLSTSIFGDAGWAIRLTAPLLHGLGAFFLFLLGKRMFDARIGAWGAAIYLLMPGIWLSSTIISTDAVLLPTYAIAVCLLWRFRDSPTVVNACLAGAAIGLSMLGKYAALYLYPGIVLAAFIDRDTRKALLSPAGAMVFIASLVVLGPNIAWNVANDFATVSHTADNANLGGADFNPLRVLTFVQDQAAVFGPLTLILLLAGFAFLAGRKDKQTATRELWLLCFIVPALAVIMMQEIISRAHANWAAAAYPAACVLLASWIDRAFGKVKVRPVLITGMAINTLIGALFALVWVSPSIADATGASAGMKGVRGWGETTRQLVAKAEELRATAILVDDRETWHALDYHGRSMAMPPIRAWPAGPTPRSHAEEAGRILPGDDTRMLIASTNEAMRPMIRADFATIEELGYLDIPLTAKRTRRFKLYLASTYHQAPRTPEFLATHVVNED